MNDAQKEKRLAYIESGRIILNPDALEDLYEALKVMVEDVDQTGYARVHHVVTGQQALAKAKVQDVNNQ